MHIYLFFIENTNYPLHDKKNLQGLPLRTLTPDIDSNRMIYLNISTIYKLNSVKIKNKNQYNPW